MYPLKVLLIGCTDNALLDLRQELANLTATIEGEFLDVRGCLTHVLKNPSSQRLFIIHPQQASDIASLERLDELVSGQPILALVDPSNDPSMMMRAMRAGAAQVVRLPLQADDFQTAMRRIAIQFGHATSKSRTITVLGASEGSGNTMVSLNLAAEIARLKAAPCILTEGAIAFGRLANYLGIEPQLTMYDLLSDIDRLDIERFRRALTKVDDNLLVLAGSYRAITPLILTLENAFKLLAFARQLAEVVVVDGRYNYEDLDFDFIDQTQQLVLVAKPTVPSLYNLRMLLDLLSKRECLAEQYVVINQFDPTAEEFSARRLRELLAVPKVYTVAVDRSAYRRAEDSGTTLRKAAPHSQAMADISALARAVLGMPAEQPAGWSFLDALSRVAHSFSVK